MGKISIERALCDVAAEDLGKVHLLNLSLDCDGTLQGKRGGGDRAFGQARRRRCVIQLCDDVESQRAARVGRAISRAAREVKPGEVVKGNLIYSGIAVQLLKTGKRQSHGFPLPRAGGQGARTAETATAADRLWKLIETKEDFAALASGATPPKVLGTAQAATTLQAKRDGGQAKQLGARKVVTFGGLQSNHARLTAACANQIGLECHLLYFEKKPPKLEGNLLLNQHLGARFHFIPMQQVIIEILISSQMECYPPSIMLIGCIMLAVAERIVKETY